MPLADVTQRIDPRVGVIQARDVVELAPTGMQKCLAPFHVDLFECLKAVAVKAGANHVYPGGTGLGQSDQTRLGVGLQPFGATQT